MVSPGIDLSNDLVATQIPILSTEASVLATFETTLLGTSRMLRDFSFSTPFSILENELLEGSLVEHEVL